MEKERIEMIRSLGDRIANEIMRRNDKKLFQNLWQINRYSELRALLIRAGMRRTERGEGPLVTFEEFVTIFECGEETQRNDWGLARDLLLIRVVEQLNHSGWFQKNRDAIPEIVEALPEGKAHSLEGETLSLASSEG